ncbi:MAG: hypothetical protein U0K36_02630 [Bacteroidales bacterium]|nr:hypothetical protein [Bacteroidales bacterium]
MKSIGHPTGATDAEVAKTELNGKKCVVAGFGESAYGRPGATGEDAVETALMRTLQRMGAGSLCAPGGWTEQGGEELADKFEKCDILFFIGQKLTFGDKDKKRTWRLNVDATKYALTAAEEAGIKRVVMLGSILSLGHRQDRQPVDASTPYLSDDERTVCERSLFKQEMLAWEMAERGMAVSVVCGGWPITCLEANATEVGQNPQWLDNDIIARHPGAFCTAQAIADALVAAAKDSMTGKRLICTGIETNKLKTNNRANWLKGMMRKITDKEGAASAIKVLERTGAYSSDFAVRPLVD